MEWLLAHLPRVVANALRKWLGRPQPDIRILSLEERGSLAGVVDFAAEVANYGTQMCRTRFTATVGDVAVVVQPTTLDILPNSSPDVVRVRVPRPDLGDLVQAMNNATTLYGQELTLRATIDDRRGVKTRSWREPIPDIESDRGRYDALMEAWRIRTEGMTEADEIRQRQQDLLRTNHENAANQQRS